MAEKLNSMRLLDRQKIAYIARDFPASIHSADGVADYFDLPHKMVYKTLVVLTNAKKPCLVMVAGNHALNLKLFAKAIGQKKFIWPLTKRQSGLQVYKQAVYRPWLCLIRITLFTLMNRCYS